MSKKVATQDDGMIVTALTLATVILIVLGFSMVG